MAKREPEDIDVNEIIESVNLNKGTLDRLLNLSRDELSAVLADIANRGQIPTSAFKKTRAELPSFSKVKWMNFALQYGLPMHPTTMDTETCMASFEHFRTPRYRLPPSLHKTMFENGWCWQDVYREVVYKTREETRVRILDPYIVPIVALFHGRVIDKPEQAMPETRYSTGGDVEHKFFMIGRVFFFVVELKLSAPDANALAQFFLELLSAAEINKRIKFEGLRIYGLLTNLVHFSFYSYNPATRQFYFDESIVINNKRTGALSDMVDVSNKIFGLVLSAYIEGLDAIVKRSKERAKNNDFSPVGSSPEQQIGQRSLLPTPEPPRLTETSDHKSTDHWEAALVLARASCAVFDKPAQSIEDIENNANEALILLTESVHSIPRVSPSTGRDDDGSTPAKLKILADHLVTEVHQKILLNT